MIGIGLGITSSSGRGGGAAGGSTSSAGVPLLLMEDGISSQLRNDLTWSLPSSGSTDTYATLLRRASL